MKPHTLWKHPLSYLYSSIPQSLHCWSSEDDCSIRLNTPLKHFWFGDLDFRAMTLAFKLDLDTLPLDLHTKNQVRMSVHLWTQLFATWIVHHSKKWCTNALILLSRGAQMPEEVQTDRKTVNVKTITTITDAGFNDMQHCVASWCDVGLLLHSEVILLWHPTFVTWWV